VKLLKSPLFVEVYMVTFRPVRVTDAESILRIYSYFINKGPVTFEIVPPTAEEFALRIATISAKYPFIVIEENNNIIGYTYASAHRERIAYQWTVETSIYLSVDSQGKGLGKALYMTLIHELKNRNFTTAYALIGLPHPGSIALHSSCGFAHFALHEKAGYKLGAWHDVLWMKKELLPFSNPPYAPKFMPFTETGVLIP
jgi:L-amino acid N-acyltransferase YncA